MRNILSSFSFNNIALLFDENIWVKYIIVPSIIPISADMEGLINPKITTKNGTRNEFNPFAIEMLKKSMSKFLDFRFIIFFVKKSYLFLEIWRL